MFKEKSVRLIDINNGIDSANQQDSDFTSFLNIMNEWNARDAIRKIQAVFKSRMQDGKRISPNIPYGYLRSREDKQKLMNLISTDDYSIDTEYAVEVNDYKSKPILTRAASTVSRVECGQQWRIYRKSDNATMVQWVLRGLFLYNGKTSQCKQTSMSCYNNASNAFTVISKSLKLSFWKTRFWCWYI